MSEILSKEYQHMVANELTHQAQMQTEIYRQAIYYQMERMSVVLKPKLSVDGDQWCCLYGDDLMNGVAGFGASPAEAMKDFDRAMEVKLPRKA